MRVRLFCPTCGEQRPNDPIELIWLPLRADGLYFFDCDHGHRQLVVQREPLYLLLAETAVQAIVDGYFRDAITSFMACLERFMEYYVRVVWREKKRPREVVDKAWGLVARQSERQLGLFLATYIAEQGEVPSYPDVSAFRNKVVHQGHLPTQAEAIDFGQKVLDFVLSESAALGWENGVGAILEELSNPALTKVREAEGDPNIRVNWLAPGMLHEGLPRGTSRIDLADLVRNRRRRRGEAVWQGVHRYE